jgi:hypothetical protein
VGALSGPVARHLEPVGSDFRRVETVSRELRETQLPVYGPGAAPVRRSSLRSEAPELLQTVAALLWQGWLIVAGALVGLAALAVLLRVAVAVVRWSL